MNKFEAGKPIDQGSYRCFVPNSVNRAWQVDDMELISMLSNADIHLGRLDMYSEYVPNIDLYIQMHVVKEATQSSKIEGTQTNIQEALLDVEDIMDEKRDDWNEVHNYISALNHTIGLLDKLPFSSRLIKEAHKVLLSGVRGEHKLPGEFRRSQNWIGGATINDALFVPPIHTMVNELMGDLEKFAHNSEIFLPELLRIALIHYQFETIHPFLNGNGRVGRLIIILYLMEKKLLKRPVLYLSDFFEKNRMLYYDNLMIARAKNDLNRWFKFFLAGVTETAKSGIATFDQIMKLKSDTENQVKGLGLRSNHALIVLEHLYRKPFISASKVIEVTGLSAPTAYKLIGEMESFGILKEITGSKRKRMYVFDNYLKLF
jgi:Fic family protein